MARNKYPEETRSKIVDVATRLFLEKGYDNTSVQDIVGQLGGLSKGAIYHHFRSKEGILDAVLDRIYATQPGDMTNAMNMPNATGLEKLRAALSASVNNPGQDELFRMAPNFLDNPQMLAMQVRSIYETSAPEFLGPLIEEGVADGSLETDYPLALAEVLLLLLNLWIMPVARMQNASPFSDRVGLLRELLDKLSLDILDDATIDRLDELTQLYHRER